MGLTVYAYSKIKKTDLTQDEYGDFRDKDGNLICDDIVVVSINHHFPERCADIDAGAYSYDDCECGFNRGYGYYNNWRNSLAKMAGYPPVQVDQYKTGNFQTRYDYSAWNCESGDFWELICFSDCEGSIGTKVSEKLYGDFLKFEEKAKLDGKEFLEVYLQFKRSFEIAKESGVVTFG